MKKKQERKFVIGIDEVGRGALAGPVVVAVAMMRVDPRHLQSAALGELRDSKKLSPAKRVAWCDYFKHNADISFFLAGASPRVIESHNISSAANRAAHRAYLRLLRSQNQSINAAPVFLDGGLFLKSKQWQGAHYHYAKTLPKADETIPIVAIASIIAKVHRDRFMCRLAKQYPLYGFEVHKGYGTKAHYRALRQHGPSEAHRKTFLNRLTFSS